MPFLQNPLLDFGVHGADVTAVLRFKDFFCLAFRLVNVDVEVAGFVFRVQMGLRSSLNEGGGAFYGFFLRRDPAILSFLGNPKDDPFFRLQRADGVIGIL